MNESVPVDASTSVADEVYRELEQFLYREAELLDDYRLEEWLDCLADDITIRAPIRRDTHPGTEQSEFTRDGYYIYNEHDVLRERVTRLGKEYAWAENPRSRVRHNITNVRVTDADDGEYVVENNQLVYRSHGNTAEHDVLSAERETTLRRVDDGFEVADRTIYFDDSVIDLKNLTIVLL